MNPEKREELEADLSAYLDGELSEARSRLIERKLSESKELRRKFDDLRSAAEHVASLQRVRSPDGVPEAVAEQLARNSVLSTPGEARYARLSRWLPRVAGIAAVLVACILIGVQAFGPDVPREQAGTTAEPAAPRREAAPMDRLARERDQVAIDLNAEKQLAARGIDRRGGRAKADEVASGLSPGAAVSLGLPAREDNLPPGGDEPDRAAAYSIESLSPPTPASDVGGAAAPPEGRVQVEVEARSHDALLAAMDQLARWEPDLRRVVGGRGAERGAKATGPVRRLRGARHGGDSKPFEVTFRIPGTAVPRLLDALEAAAPSQVRVELSGPWSLYQYASAGNGADRGATLDEAPGPREGLQSRGRRGREVSSGDEHDEPGNVVCYVVLIPPAGTSAEITTQPARPTSTTQDSPRPLTPADESTRPPALPATRPSHPR